MLFRSGLKSLNLSIVRNTLFILLPFIGGSTSKENAVVLFSFKILAIDILFVSKMILQFENVANLRIIGYNRFT